MSIIGMPRSRLATSIANIESAARSGCRALIFLAWLMRTVVPSSWRLHIHGTPPIPKTPTSLPVSRRVACAFQLKPPAAGMQVR